MTDLHTHILPFMDDGAKDLDESVGLLLQQKQQGVSRIALTSHFDCETMDVNAFLERRAASCGELMAHLGPQLRDMQFKLGCEVRYSPNLQDVAHWLCLEGTDMILLELPTSHCPAFLDRTLCSFRADGIIPLIAHVERYPYVLNNPAILYKWIANGACIQVNAGALLGGGPKKQILNMIRWGLVHVISSDTHSLQRRPPNLSKAMHVVERALGKETVRRLRQNAADLFDGEEPRIGEIHKPRSLFGLWL